LLADQFLEAAAAAKNTHAIDDIARLTWRAQVEGHLAYSEAEAVSVALQARRKAFAAGQGLPARKSVVVAPWPARRPPRSPDRQRSLERRRRQAMSGVIPSKIAAGFTQGENAVLTVIGRQCQRGGACSLHIDAIAALAGVSRTTVQNALRAARGQGLLLVKERRIPGRRSLTNVVSIISQEWAAWLRLGGIGFKKMNTPENPNKQEGKSAPIGACCGAAFGGKDRPDGRKGHSRKEGARTVPFP
jgi:hypothetical protein